MPTTPPRMSSSVVLGALFVAGLALIAIGLERFVNVYLIGGQSAGAFARLLIGVVCLTAGGVLLVLSVYLRPRARR